MDFGFNPVFAAVPAGGRRRGPPTASGRDFEVYGVTGTTKVLGVQTVTVPAGTFQALAVQTHAEPARLPVRQRHADGVVRARQGAREARLPPRRRQRLRRRAARQVRPNSAPITLGVVAVLAVAAGTGNDRRAPSQAQPRTGCGRRLRSTGERHRERHAGTALACACCAYRDFTKPGGTTKGVTIRLAAAAVTFERLQRRLARLEAPPEAATLRKRLLSLVAQQVAVTREVRAMAVFAPPYASALTQSRAAAAAFSRALRSVTVPTPPKLQGHAGGGGGGAAEVRG